MDNHANFLFHLWRWPKPSSDDREKSILPQSAATQATTSSQSFLLLKEASDPPNMQPLQRGNDGNWCRICESIENTDSLYLNKKNRFLLLRLLSLLAVVGRK